jgi:hypothetical protein
MTDLTRNDRAIVQLLYSRDLMINGRIKEAFQLIGYAIDLIGKQDPMAIDNEVLKRLCDSHG